MHRVRVSAVRLRRLAGAGLLVIACAPLAACGDDESASSTRASATTTTAAAAPAEPARTIADARRAVDRDDYADGLAIARPLGAAQARSVRQRIANRLAERALAALDAGERGRARELVIAAKRYPSTDQTRIARALYDDAKAQAAQERRRNAEQQRLAEAMRQAGSMKRQPMRMTPPSSMEMTPPPSMGMTP